MMNSPSGPEKHDINNNWQLHFTVNYGERYVSFGKNNFLCAVNISLIFSQLKITFYLRKTHVKATKEASNVLQK